MPDNHHTPEPWVDALLVTDDPSEEFLATLRSDLAEEWRSDGRMRIVGLAPSPTSSGRRVAVVAGLAAAAIVAVVTAVVVTRDDSVRTVPADTTTMTTTDSGPATTVPATVVPATTVPATEPTSTPPASTETSAPTTAPTTSGPTTTAGTAPATPGGPATAGALVGSWLSPAGDRISLLESGFVALGPCDPSGRWELDGDVLSITGIDPALVAACRSTTTFLPSIETALTAGSLTATVAMTDGGPVLTIDGVDIALTPAPTEIAVFDIRAGAAYGFAPYATISVDEVIQIVSQRAGQPDYDSGWYVIPPDPRIQEGDCMPGMNARAIAWGPVSMMFLEYFDGERLWISGYGQHRRLVEAAETSGRPLPPAIIDADFNGLPASLDDLAAAGYAVDGLSIGFEPVDDPLDATNGELPEVNPYVTVTLDSGLVTGYDATNTGFC